MPCDACILRQVLKTAQYFTGNKLLVWRQGDKYKILGQREAVRLEATLPPHCFKGKNNAYIIETTQALNAIKNKKRVTIELHDEYPVIDQTRIGGLGVKPKKIPEIDAEYTGYIEPAEGMIELVDALDTASIVSGFSDTGSYLLGTLYVSSPSLRNGPYVWDDIILTDVVREKKPGNSKITIISKHYFAPLIRIPGVRIYYPSKILYPVKAETVLGENAKLRIYVAPVLLNDEEKALAERIQRYGAVTDHILSDKYIAFKGSDAHKLALIMTPGSYIYSGRLVQPLCNNTVQVINLEVFNPVNRMDPGEAYEVTRLVSPTARIVAKHSRTIAIKLLGDKLFYWDEEIGMKVDPENPEALVELSKPYSKLFGAWIYEAFKPRDLEKIIEKTRANHPCDKVVFLSRNGRCDILVEADKERRRIGETRCNFGDSFKIPLHVLRTGYLFNGVLVARHDPKWLLASYGEYGYAVVEQ